MSGGAGLVAALSILSVVLLGWAGVNGDAGRVFGLLSVMWALVMMLRLMALTEQRDEAPDRATLAGKLLVMLQAGMERQGQKTLEFSLSPAYTAFAGIELALGGWLFFCAVFPHESAQQKIWDAAAGTSTGQLSFLGNDLYLWGERFMALLCLAVGAFLWRSHAGKAVSRFAALICAGYGLAGAILFVGGSNTMTASPGLMPAIGGYSHGARALSLPADARISLFDEVMLQAGIIGFLLVAALACVPVARLCAAWREARARMMAASGLLAAGAMTGVLFVPPGPFTPAFLATCWIGLLAAWGAAERAVEPS